EAKGEPLLGRTPGGEGEDRSALRPLGVEERPLLVEEDRVRAGRDREALLDEAGGDGEPGREPEGLVQLAPEDPAVAWPRARARPARRALRRAARRTRLARAGPRAGPARRSWRGGRRPARLRDRAGRGAGRPAGARARAPPPGRRPAPGRPPPGVGRPRDRAP